MSLGKVKGTSIKRLLYEAEKKMSAGCKFSVKKRFEEGDFGSTDWMQSMI